MAGLSPGPDRKAELAANLAELRQRIDAACRTAGRASTEVTLVAVTKTFSVADIALLSELGITDIGENRDQEAAAKAAEGAALGLQLRWHFVGQLQLNKVKSVARYADVVHSVDRMRLVAALSARASAAGRTLTCLVQVNLDETGQARQASGAEPVGRGGALPAAVPELAAAVAAADGLTLGGVMAVAPLDGPAGPAFRQLSQIAGQLRQVHPAATMISAGMSGDLEEAILAGATHLRIGTALLGSRPAFVR